MAILEIDSITKDAKGRKNEEEFNVNRIQGDFFNIFRASFSNCKLFIEGQLKIELNIL
jgi:hypothetical protein